MKIWVYFQQPSDSHLDLIYSNNKHYLKKKKIFQMFWRFQDKP